MTRKDLKQRYLGSYLGVLWAFIQPTITVCIFWFVFQVGFKSIPVDNFPFILWLHQFTGFSGACKLIKFYIKITYESLIVVK